MSLRMILGRAGSGKTRFCLQEITARLKENVTDPLILLVPEQATFHTEKKLLEYEQIGGTINAQVLSFQRLCWRILQETGGNSRPPIDEVGKSLIIKRVLEKAKPEISFFGRVLDKPGFVKTLAQSISEFKTYNVYPQDLAQCLERLDRDADNVFPKLQDLYLIYREYEKYLQDSYLDLDDNLTILAGNIHKAGLLNSAEIWIDGFHGFTPQEYQVLQELFLKVPRVNITLCLDKTHTAQRLEEHDIFYPPWETYQRLLEIAGRVGCPVEDKIFLTANPPRRFSAQPELAFLERSFVSPGEKFAGKVQAIKLAIGANIRAEIEGIAREIIALCRDKGYRYQDIAVLARDLRPYEKLLPSIFSAYGIPFFLDKKRPLQHHPLLDLTKGALEVAVKGWNYEPLFRYLKSDLANISRRETDILENYCLAHGIRGSRWNDGKPWTYRRSLTLPRDNTIYPGNDEEERLLARINKARYKVVSCLGKFVEAVHQAKQGRDFALSLYNLYSDLSVVRKLEYWSRAAEKEGSPEEAQIHSQVWNKTMALLDQAAQVLGTEELTVAEFSRIIEEGLDSIELGLIPPGLDQVIVGSVDRSRNPDLKAAFILGAVEGVFPSRGPEEGLINDEERKLLADMGLVLAPSATVQVFNEQFLVYSALTRASECLWLSCPQADKEGKALQPSPLFKSIEKLFPEQGIEIFWGQEPDGQNDPDFLAHPGPGLGYLAVGLRKMLEGKERNLFWRCVYNWYLAQEEWQDSLQRIVKALLEENNQERLTPEQARKLYGIRSSERGRILQASVSRLEKHKACPFSHFLTYGLKLKEREEYRLRAPDLGQFFHEALEGVYGELEKEGKTLGDKSSQETIQLVSKVVDNLVPLLQNELLLSTARHRYLAGKLKRTVLRAVKVLREHELRGTFRPLGVEIAFGPGGKLPGLEIVLSDGTVLLLQGRIDRVDSAEDEKGTYLRVIDYKSGAPTLSLLEIYYGLKLQLLAYLDVVMRYAPGLIEREVLPAGILYFRIKNPFINAKGPLEASVVEGEILRQLKMKGYLLKEESLIKLMDREIQGYSEILPVAFSEKSGFYRGGENLLTSEEFQALRSYLEGVLRGLGEEIISGNIAVQPYYYKGKKPCSYCEYSAVCRFETLIPGNTYLQLKDKEPGEIWAELLRKGSEVND